MITTFTGKGDEKEEIYLIGGLGKPIHYRGFREISKLGKTGLFETISTKLKHGRAYHIALPISYDLVKESCKGPSPWGKFEVLIVLSVFSVFNEKFAFHFGYTS